MKFSIRIIIGPCLIRKTMAYYITRVLSRPFHSSAFLKQEIRFLYDKYDYKYDFIKMIKILVLVILPLCTALSDDQNSKLESEIKDLEILVFREIPCQNCTLDTRVKYLRLTLDKVLTTDSLDRSGNWSQKFVLGLAGQITGFVFNVIIAVLGIYLSFRINKKFKRWEESEEIKILRKLEWMQFPPAAEMERCLLPERR